MDESKGPRPVAWEGWHATITGEKPRGVLPGFVDVQEHEADEPARDYTMTPDEAETHGHALIMAAAVARGEQGHTAALNRVAAVLVGGGVSVRDLPGEAARSLSALMDERDRLRRDCDAAAEACGVAVVSQVPEAWRLLAEGRDRLRGEADAIRDALGVVGNGSPLLAADALREEADALRASVAELREDLADAEAARADAVQEAARLRVDLSAAQVELSGARDLVRACHGLLYSGGTPTREPMTHASLASIAAAVQGVGL